MHFSPYADPPPRKPGPLIFTRHVHQRSQISSNAYDVAPGPATSAACRLSAKVEAEACAITKEMHVSEWCCGHSAAGFRLRSRAWPSVALAQWLSWWRSLPPTWLPGVSCQSFSHCLQLRLEKICAERGVRKHWQGVRCQM